MPAMSKKDQTERVEAIAALLRKAEAAGTPEEAQAFSDGAMRLAKKYEIDLTMARQAARDPNSALRQTDARKRTAQEEKDKYEIKLGRPKMQQMQLAGVVFRFAGCYLLRWGTGNTLKLVAFGYTSDIETGKMLWESLNRQAILQAAVRYRSHVEERDLLGRPAEVERTFRRGFWAQFAYVVEGRFNAISREVTDFADAATPGSALAIRSKEDEIRSWVDQMFGVSKKGPRRARGSKSMAGYIAGQQAGREADLGFKKLGTTRQELEG
jgi:hypothetical protein